MIKIFFVWLLFGFIILLLCCLTNILFLKIYSSKHKDNNDITKYVITWGFNFALFNLYIWDFITFRNRSNKEYEIISERSSSDAFDFVNQVMENKNDEAKKRFIVYAFLTILVWPIYIITTVLNIYKTYKDLGV